MRLCEFKAVLQEVPNGREEHFPVNIERKLRVNRADCEKAPSRLRLEGGRYCYIGDEIKERHQLVSRRHPCRYAHIGEGAIYETAHLYQGAVQDGACCARQPDIACFDGCNGQRRYMEMIPQFVRQKSQPFVQGLCIIIFFNRIALKCIFGHRVGDTIVEAAV
jgi:hypothetical protein